MSSGWFIYIFMKFNLFYMRFCVFVCVCVVCVQTQTVIEEANNSNQLKGIYETTSVCSCAVHPWCGLWIDIHKTKRNLTRERETKKMTSNCVL